MKNDIDSDQWKKLCIDRLLNNDIMCDDWRMTV